MAPYPSCLCLFPPPFSVSVLCRYCYEEPNELELVWDKGDASGLVREISWRERQAGERDGLERETGW
jgi:hypothetical protein